MSGVGRDPDFLAVMFVMLLISLCYPATFAVGFVARTLWDSAVQITSVRCQYPLSLITIIRDRASVYSCALWRDLRYGRR